MYIRSGANKNWRKIKTCQPFIISTVQSRSQVVLPSMKAFLCEKLACLLIITVHSDKQHKNRNSVVLMPTASVNSDAFQGRLFILLLIAKTNYLHNEVNPYTKKKS